MLGFEVRATSGGCCYYPVGAGDVVINCRKGGPARGAAASGSRLDHVTRPNVRHVVSLSFRFRLVSPPYSPRLQTSFLPLSSYNRHLSPLKTRPLPRPSPTTDHTRIIQLVGRRRKHAPPRTDRSSVMRQVRERNGRQSGLLICIPGRGQEKVFTYKTSMLWAS